ncbi:acetyl-CoA synthetase [Dyadobacter sp. BE34]|uniref:Acetate--CoA ligase n=1 Tax=Dyadobacter fermentans TaxID=94254 RepID=A0ABU1QS60_9BACT|nr:MULTISPECIES: acetate--CoA ligase [Dyadobacter]MBZ1358132.1 acetate--CoA ligase [Dyadobacter fermentans]MDR6804000.1 acetyl-CoA synthetase [Dyadobacter fermentans]MDR7041740.1 acetyl-CoA synthetase [Dyadobacter sp. BE242]MDR7196143.1 acetyl-CoA synthetase [Dyadobacter sp. BE34]MDR7213312.1 acetyl-CoA synthetase [Dyadobacter sp. BE31]
MRIKTFEEYKVAYQQSVDDPEGFWAEVAQQFQWRKPWKKVLSWDFQEARTKWFEGGVMNITENALDRHLAERGDQPAIIWEPNNPEDQAVTLTYHVLFEQVCRFANVLKKHGVKKGDRICIYLPMVPELAVAVLACARIGAVHSVVFGGFSAKSIADRINDAECSMVITSDGAFRGSKVIPMKDTVDEALVQCSTVQKVIVLTRTRTPVHMLKGRDLWWEDEMKQVNSVCPAEPMDAEDMLFILYTSGSTGKPKGVVHTCGGYMVYATYTFANVFQYEPGEVHFCTADIGWITGHSYIVYGPLCYGATSVVFEGVPTYPDASRFWKIVERHKVNILYTAPTAIRSLMGFGLDYVKGHDFSSLKKLGSVGEPINEEAWHWYKTNIGGDHCPLVDTWWQTENGGIMISPLAGVTPEKPTFATLPLPGIQPVLVDESGNEIEGNGVSGNLCIKFPWPGIIRTTYGDHERCRQTYFSTYPGKYFTGDGCLRDEDGYYRITGRVDDVLNVSGHRIGTAEVENAINMHLGVVESAVVGYPHDIKGQGIYAFVIAEQTSEDPDMFRKDIAVTVSRIIGPIAKPDKIQFVSGLPKTRSGKIMRRILRKISEGDVSNLGDTSTLLDPAVVEEIKAGKL